MNENGINESKRNNDSIEATPPIMTPKKTNWLFAIIIMCQLLMAVIVATVSEYVRLNIYWVLILSQLSFFIPTVIFVKATGASFKDLVPMKKLKVSTQFWVILFTILCLPLIYFINMISMFFVSNVVMDQLAPAMTGVPGIPLGVTVFLAILLIGIIAPLNEEFCYRGVIYYGYRSSGRIVASILLSSFLFGLMHMNFNQMAYAIVIGVLICLVLECTGNLLMAILSHAVINLIGVFAMFSGGVNDVDTPTSASFREIMEAEIAAELPYYIDFDLPEIFFTFVIIGFMIIFLILAIGFMVLAYLVLRKIAGNEGRLEHLKSILPKSKKARKLLKTEQSLASSESSLDGVSEGSEDCEVSEVNYEIPSKVKLWSTPLIIACVVCLSLMILSLLNFS